MGEMNSFSLLEFYDELLAEESILYEKGRDSEYFYDYVTSLQTHEAQKKTTATISPLEDQLSSQLVFKLEQKIRILTIQCDEEKEIRVDLEIENIKLKKEIGMLRSTLESINNNVYDEEFADDLDLADITGADETLQDLDHSQLELDSIPILSDETMNRSRLLSVTMTPAPIKNETPATRKVQFSTETFIKKVHPPSKLGKCSTDTYTKKTRPRPGLPLPVVKIVEPSTPQSKQARRRSRSVDFFVGEKTVITPQRCQICLKAARERRYSYNYILSFFRTNLVILVQFCLPHEMHLISIQAGGFAHTPVVSSPGHRQHLGNYDHLYNRHSQKNNELQDFGSKIKGRWQPVCFNAATENSEAAITSTEVDFRGEEVLPHILCVKITCYEIEI